MLVLGSQLGSELGLKTGLLPSGTYIYSEIMKKYVPEKIYPFYFYNRKAICYLTKKRHKNKVIVYEVCEPTRYFSYKSGVPCSLKTKKCLGRLTLIALINEPIIFDNRITRGTKVVNLGRHDFIKTWRVFPVYITNYINRRKKELMEKMRKIRKTRRIMIPVTPILITMPVLNKPIIKRVRYLKIKRPTKIVRFKTSPIKVRIGKMKAAKSLRTKAVRIAYKRDLKKKITHQRKHRQRRVSIKRIRPRAAHVQRHKSIRRSVTRKVMTAQKVQTQRATKSTTKVKTRKQPMVQKETVKSVPVKAGLLDTLKSIPKPVLIGGGVLLLALLMMGGKTDDGYVPILYR